MEGDDDWYDRYIQDGNDFRSAFEPSPPSAFSSSILGYPIQHNQQFDVPDISHGPSLESSMISPDHATEAEQPSSAQEPPPFDRLKGSQSTIEEPGSQSLAQQTAKPRSKNERIPDGYHCPDCKLLGTDRPFDTPSEMQKHRYQVHTPKSERPFGCAICDERFLYQKDLTRHMRTHDRRTSSRKSVQVNRTCPQNATTNNPPKASLSMGQANGRTLETGDRTMTPAKRRRCSLSFSVRDPEVTDEHNTVQADSPPFESNHHHETAGEFLAAGYQDLRRFFNLGATHVTIIAKTQDHEETTTFIAHHKLPALSTLEPDSQPQIKAKGPCDDSGMKEAPCVAE